jgi:nucleotide-binding universal stress UspA family protein
MNTILVPIDFSDASRNAFRYALRIANLFHAKVTVFHAYSIQVAEPYMVPATQEIMINQQEERIQEYFEELEREEVPEEIAHNIELEFRIALGPATDEILFQCEELNPGLLVMGMKSSGELTKTLLGSTSSRIVQRCPYPILIVPEEASYHGIRKLAYATNFEENDIKAIDELLEFAFLYDAVIHCVHVREGGAPIDMAAREQALKSHYKDDVVLHKLEFQHISDEDVVEGLNEYIQEKKIDMLAMLTHKRGFWGRVFHQSTAKQMALHTQVPVLIYQMND